MAYCIKHRRFTARWSVVSIDGEHHADDIVVLVKSKRGAQRLLKNSRKLLEGKLKLKLNTDKSRLVIIFSHKQFKFLGFCLGKNGKGIYIRGYRKSLDKVQAKAADKTQSGQKCLCSDGKCKMVHPWMDLVFLCSDIKHTLQSWNEWLRCRFRTYIWKQWKKPKTRVENLMKLGFPEWRACEVAYSRKSYWLSSHHASVQAAISNKRLAQAGYFDFPALYESLHLSD